MRQTFFVNKVKNLDTKDLWIRQIDTSIQNKDINNGGVVESRSRLQISAIKEGAKE